MQNATSNLLSSPEATQIQEFPEITIKSIQDWLASYISELVEIDTEEIDLKTPFEGYGLDSAAAVAMTGDLEDWLGHELQPTLVYDYPTIEGLAKHLVSEFGDDEKG